MDVKGILDKIEADAREAAAQTLEQAQARIDALRAANDAAQHQQLAAMEEKIKADAAEMEGRMIRMAELEDKKARLAAKREVMDDTFRLAQDKLCTLPDAKKRAFFSCFPRRTAARFSASAERRAAGMEILSLPKRTKN